MAGVWIPAKNVLAQNIGHSARTAGYSFFYLMITELSSDFNINLLFSVKRSS